MSALLVRGAAAETVVEVTPQTAGWSYVGFEVLRPTGELRRRADGRETCVVVIAGSCELDAGDVGWPELGGRETPFDARPDAVYLPPGIDYRIRPVSDEIEVAICTAPARGGITAHRVEPEAVEVETRGRGEFEREIRPILMDAERPQAESLLVCEVITPAGHWSSFPPHKHDRDELPSESLLEETYYHRTSRPSGFGLQRVYTADGSIDEAIAFGDRDTVLVPGGYHVVSAPPGYDLYYLNAMAGPVRRWAVAEDPAHAWIST